MCSGASFPGVKRLGREADHSVASSAEVKNSGAIPTRLHGTVLNYTMQRRNKLTFKYNGNCTKVSEHLIHSSIALQPFVRPSPLFQFRNILIQTAGLLGRVSRSQGRYLHTGQHKQRIKANTGIHALSGIQTHDPKFRVSKDSSHLKPRGHSDRLSGYLLPLFSGYGWRRDHCVPLKNS
jgi:hypothetical protein